MTNPNTSSFLTSSRFAFTVLSAAVLLALLPSHSVHAGTIYWDGGGSNNNWSTLNNWGTLASGTNTNPAAIPGSSDDVVFYSTGAARLTTGSIDQAFTLNTLTFGNGQTGAVTIAATAGQTLTLNGTSNYDPSNYSSGSSTNLGTVGLYVQSGFGAISLGTSSASIAIGGAQSWINNSSNTLNVNGAITYNNLLTFNGGSFTLNTSGTAVGGAKITNGSTVINASTGAIFGNGTLELNSGTLKNSTTNTTRTLANAVSITGDFTLDSGGATGNNAFTGATTTTGSHTLTVNTATATFSNGTALSLGGDLTVNGSGGIQLTGTGGITSSGTSNITISTTGSIASTLGTGPINTTGTITNNGSGASTTTLSGVVGANVTAITQNAANGTLVLSGANAAYAGTTTLTSGTITLSNASALGTGNLVINGGSLGGTSNLTSGNAVGTGTITGSPTTTLAVTSNVGLAVGQQIVGTNIPTGTYITAISGTNVTLSNATTGNGSAIALSIGSNVTQTWNSDYTFASGTLNMGQGAISLGTAAGATRTVTTTAGSLIEGGAISNGTNGITPTVNLVKDGAGTLTLAGKLDYTGTTTVTAGTLILSGNNSAGTAYNGGITLNGGTLQGKNGAFSNTFSAFGTSTLTLNGGTLQLAANSAGQSQTIAAGNNVVMGSSAVTINVDKAGGFNNSGNTFSMGTLSLGTGQLNVTGGNTYVLSFAGATTLTGNATINPTTAPLTLVGVIGDGASTFGITKIGSGTLTLSGSNTYKGTTSVLAGTLSLGVAAPSGSAGALGNSTSQVLLSDTTGALNATIQTSVSTATAIARDIRVQSGNTGTATISAGAGAATTTISGNITLGSDNSTGHGLTLSSSSFGTGLFTGTIQDASGMTGGTAGALTIGSGGSVALSGSNTFTGGVILSSGGVLKAQSNSAAGAGIITINGGSSLGGFGNGSATVTSLANNQIWNGDFSSGTSAGPGLITTGSISLTGSRIVSMDNTNYTANGVISDSVAGANNTLTFKNATNPTSWTLGGANTFGGGVTIVGGAAGAASVLANNTTALGSGQARLTNTTSSILSLLSNLTIDSLTSGINTPTFTAGSGMTSGTYGLVFAGGGGSGATGTAIVSGGAITSVSITNYGKDYTSAPTITITGAGGTGTISNTFGSSSVSLNSGTAETLTIAGTNASPATYAGIISGTSGNLIKSGSGTQILAGANTYTGATTISGGILSVGTLANGGSASGIGQSTNVATNLVLNGGTLQYTGTAQSTDRLFSVGSSGGTIDASGIGALNLTNTNSMAFNSQTGTRTLTLAGSNTGVNTLAAVIGDNSGSTSLTKSGAGTWQLTGSNTYTGPTTVENGTLAVGVSGSISGSLVLGKSGGTTGILDVTSKASFSETNISGNGTINIDAGNTKTVTATGNVSPGFSAGTLNVTGNFTLASTAATALEISGTGAGQFDIVAASGTFTYGGTLTVTSFGGYDLTQTGTYGLFTAGTIFAGDFNAGSSVTVNGVLLTDNSGVWSGVNGSTNYTFTDSTGILAVTAVPEPSTWAMIFAGVGMLGIYQRRRRID